jgi:hypothetical protein
LSDCRRGLTSCRKVGDLMRSKRGLTVRVVVLVIVGMCGRKRL